MMQSLLRSLRLLAIALWIGGIAFFAFVLAPVAFQILPNAHQAGLVVGAALPILDRIGLVCGLLFLAATLLLRRKAFAQTGLILVMLALTATLHFGVLPRMERDRAAAGGDITLAAPSNPARADFDRLHPLSERLEAAVLLAGLGVILLLGTERDPA